MLAIAPLVTVMVNGVVVALFDQTPTAAKVAAVPTGWSLAYPEVLPLPLSLPSSVGMGRVPYTLAGRSPILLSHESPFIICPLATTPSWQARHIMMPSSSAVLVV